MKSRSRLLLHSMLMLHTICSIVVGKIALKKCPIFNSSHHKFQKLNFSNVLNTTGIGKKYSVRIPRWFKLTKSF